MAEPAAIPSESEPSDEELAQRGQAGSFAAFEVLVRRYEARLYGFLRGCAGNDADAQDLVQAAFVTAYQALDRYESSRPFGPWLFTIARRKLIDHHRARSVRSVPLDPPESADAEDPSTILGRREEQSGFWSRVRSILNLDQYQALWLHYHEDLEIREVARTLNRSVVSVKVLLYRARQALMQRLPSDAQLANPSPSVAVSPPAEPIHQPVTVRTR